jgi:hypothetical protein
MGVLKRKDKDEVEELVVELDEDELLEESAEFEDEEDGEIPELQGFDLEQSPVPVPPSHEKFMLQKRAEIDSYFKAHGWEYRDGGEPEEKMIALWEDYVREIISEGVGMDAAWQAWQRILMERETFKADNEGVSQGVSRYIEYLQMYSQNVRSRRGLLHGTQEDDSPIDWGVDSHKLTERFGFRAKPEDEVRKRGANLLSIANLMLDDVENDFDIFAVIAMKKGDLHGGVGGGKSDFCQTLCALLDPTYDLRYRTVFCNDADRMEKLIEDQRLEIAWNWDEGELWAYKQDWMKADVKEKVKGWMTRRFLHQKVIVCIPSIWYTATNLQDRVTWFFKVLERGVIEVWRGNERTADEDQFGSKLVTTLKVGKLDPVSRAVYEVCKAYAYKEGPGALDTKLEESKGEWPYDLPKIKRLMPAGMKLGSVDGRSVVEVPQPASEKEGEDEDEDDEEEEK